jgi:prevent-host-death family protein
MKTVWQLQEAKNRLSEVVERAIHVGAQTITRHGQPVAMVVAADAYKRLQPRKSIVAVLRSCPNHNLVVDRLPDRPRTVAL